jgi:hypothetical protein
MTVQYGRSYGRKQYGTGCQDLVWDSESSEGLSWSVKPEGGEVAGDAPNA